MISRSLLLLTVIACTVLPASATYAGDRPLVAVFMDNATGYAFFTGNSTYSGTLDPGREYAVALPCDDQKDAEILYRRIYLYWAWSRDGQAAVYPDITVVPAGDPEAPLQRMDRYVDSKGFAGSNDFFSGMDAYAAPPCGQESETLTVIVRNTAVGNASFVVQGAAICSVYRCTGAPAGRVWVLEGCDMLSSTYGITPEMATSTIAFEGEVNPASARTARLCLVAPSGGYSGSELAGKNALLINRQQSGTLPPFLEAIIEALFPGYNGKELADVFDADEIQQIGVEIRDIRPYLRQRGNTVAVQDRGDYLLLTNALLWVTEGREDGACQS